MKRIISIFMIITIFSAVTVYSDTNGYVTMYAPDGREISILQNEVEAYKNVGWYENKSDVTKTMYAPDGRELIIYISEIEAYKNVGWYENIEDVTAIMCAPDGRKITVYIDEVQEYINVGWIPAQSKEIDPNKPMVALTFDDGPRSDSTGRILNTLELYNVKATFFVLGNMAVNNPQILQRMNSLGCQIGNHSYSHPNLSSLSAYNIANQINTTSEVIHNATGSYPTVVRPPYGAYNSTVLSSINAPLILWSIDTLDWKYRNASRVTNEVLSKVRDGDIVLMHDIYGSTATAVESIVPSLILKGFQLVTVEELAVYKNFQMNAHKTYGSFR